MPAVIYGKSVLGFKYEPLIPPLRKMSSAKRLLYHETMSRSQLIDVIQKLNIHVEDLEEEVKHKEKYIKELRKQLGLVKTVPILSKDMFRE